MMLNVPIDPPHEGPATSPPLPAAPRLWHGALAWLAMCVASLGLESFGIVDGLWIAVPLVGVLVGARILDQWRRAREWVPFIGGLVAGGLLSGGIGSIIVYRRAAMETRGHYWYGIGNLEGLLELGVAFLAPGIVSFLFLIRRVRVLTLRTFGLKSRSAVHTVSAVLYLATLPLSAALLLLFRKDPGGNILLYLTDPLISLFSDVALALAGVGFLLTRDARASLSRLGFRWINGRQLCWSMGIALLFLAGAVLMSYVESALFPNLHALEHRFPLKFVNMPPLVGAGLVSLAAAAGEEAIFRGALQPRFGILPTALLFGSLHIQYQLPGILILFLVGVGLGLIKERTSTTFVACIHMFYDLGTFLLPDL